ncbi:MAG: GGDEF domain-containing protein [Gammaproteobacteria bacterium]|nr:GGDEF domain-containing protein [Gammaproteobacteria bacterium]
MSQVPDHILQRLRTCTSFPTPPAVAMQVLQLAQDPEIDLGKVAEAVSVDPAIAAKVMRIANSAMYARRRQSTNLRQALIVLGLNATLTLALSFTLVSALKKNSTKGFDFNAYWRRTVLASAWGKLLASETGRRDAEEIFLAALLQDLGMLVIDKIWPEVYEGIAPFKIEHSRICQHEQNCIGTDHRSIGAALLRIWNMPESLVRAVQHSHDPSAAGVDGEEKPFVRAVAMSGELSDVWLGSHNEVALRRVGQQAHRYLGIQPNRLGELFDAVREQLPVAEELFQMELFDAAQLQDITDAAQETLIVRNLYQINANEEAQQEKHALEKEHRKLKTETIRDVLTNAYNRRHFENRLGAEFKACADSGYSWPLSLIFIDLDKFKDVNDSHGHQAGDAILKAVADLLVETLRDSDVVARYGGDEFVLLLPGVDTDKANIVAQRICAAVRTRKATIGADRQVGITLSLGVATCDAEHRFENAQALLAAADSALYQSKRSGRDRFTLYDKTEAA